MHRSRLRVPFAALALSLALVLAGCGSSNDPATWEEAEETGDVERNYLAACVKANTEAEGDDRMSDDEAERYCQCTFEEVREGMMFEEFEQLDDDLRSDSEALPADVRAMFEGCQ